MIEFHGTSRRLHCLSCGRRLPFTPKLLAHLPPSCARCGGLLKPDFVFFGEGIPLQAYQRAQEETRRADVWLIVGTTGEVMPASYLPVQAKKNGAFLIEINIAPSAYTQSYTDLFLHGPASRWLSALTAAVLPHRT